MYNRNLKIFRGVNNRIDIQVRNADQKASNITGSTLVFNLVSRDSKNLVLTKDFIAMDLATGKVTVTLTEMELLDLDNGFYNYSVTKEIRADIDSTDYKVTSKIPMYVDSQYDTIGTLEITGDVYGDVEPSVLVNTFNYTNPFTQGDENSRFFVSAIIDARPNLNTANTTHTFQFYTTNYQGTVTIEGSLDTQGASPRESKWATVATVDLSAAKYKNIVGKYNWFRIKHVPLTASNTARFTVAQTLFLLYEVTIGHAGKGYVVGDTIGILGAKLGGETPSNNLTITVTSVGAEGEILTTSHAGVSYNGVRTFVVDGDLAEPGTIDKILYR